MKCEDCIHKNFCDGIDCYLDNYEKIKRKPKRKDAVKTVNRKKERKQKEEDRWN